MPHVPTSHPGYNPSYPRLMLRRQAVQKHNRAAAEWGSMMGKLKVPSMPNKYVPHYGAKEAAKYATRAGRRL